jgi:hypothetical protein
MHSLPIVGHFQYQLFSINPGLYYDFSPYTGIKSMHKAVD